MKTITLLLLLLVVIGCVAARSSLEILTWQFKRFWNGSRTLWQYLWDQVYDCFDSQWQMSFWGSFIVHNTLFWIFNVAFIVIDFIEPKWALNFKIQDNQRLDTKRFVKAAARVLFNQIALTPPVIYTVYKLALWRGSSLGRELPAFEEVVLHIAVCVVVEEVMFYYSHRAFHHPKIYKHIHKVHHEWTSPIGIVSIYAHPVEHLLSNLLPVVTGPLLCGSHIAVAWLWYAIAIFSTTISHCGYHFPLLPSPEAHDYHHYAFNNCFGVLGILDRIHGTDAQFRKTKAYDRHFMTLSLVPLKALNPENAKTK